MIWACVAGDVELRYSPTPMKSAPWIGEESFARYVLCIHQQPEMDSWVT